MVKHNKTGRSTNIIGGRVIALPYSVIESPGYLNTTPMAKCVFIEIMRLYNGSNNGMIAVSCRSVGARLNVNHVTVARAIKNIINCGLLRLTKDSNFSKKRKAAEYRLTHVRCNKTNMPPSMEYKSQGKITIVAPE